MLNTLYKHPGLFYNKPGETMDGYPMNIENIEKILQAELQKAPAPLDNNQKLDLYRYIKEELSKFLEYEDINRFSNDIQVKIFGNTIRYSLFQGAKLFQTSIPQNSYDFIFEVLVETVFQAAYASYEGGFDKDERMNIIKEESVLGLLTGISVLVDREIISEQSYIEARDVINT